MKRIISPKFDELKNLQPPLKEGELKVLKYFDDNLTPDWDIYIQPHMNGLRPDFVLLSKAKGIAVFEVKDWDLSTNNYVFEEKSSGKHHLIRKDQVKMFRMPGEDPFQKIKLFKQEIFDLYCPSLHQRSGRNIIWSGVIFPFANKEQIDGLHIPPNHNPSPIIISSDELKDNNLPFKILANKDMNDDIYDDLRHWLVEPEFSSEQRIKLIDELEPRQKELALTRTESGRRRIRGPAGSGKTMVLCCRGAQLASENKNVLFVTFNITLINYLLDLAVRYKRDGKVINQITALNFHGLVKRKAFEGDFEDEYNDSWGDFRTNQIALDTGLAKNLSNWADDLDEEDKYDGIFIDEGQDFMQEWLDAISKLVKKNGELVLCVDQTQNIYERKLFNSKQMAVRGFGNAWFNLTTSYRMPISLCKLSANFIEMFLPDTENIRPLPLQDDIEFKTILKWKECNEQNMIKETVKALLEIIKENESTAFADLTCIVDRKANGQAIAKLLREKNIKCIDTFAKQDKEGKRQKMRFYKGVAQVKLTTINSFKGWEAKSIVIQSTRIKSISQKALFFSALTRLKKTDNGCFLTVINISENLEKYGRTWPHFEYIKN